MILKNKAYDVLKTTTSVILPALTVLYLALAPLWNLPQQEKVAGTIAAINVFLGAIMRISSRTYNNSDERFDGDLVHYGDPGEKSFVAALKEHPDKILDKPTVTFRVKHAAKDD